VLKKNLLYNSILSVSQILFPLIVFPYTFKVLELQGTGLVSFTESLTQYLISLAAVGIPIYGIREVAKIKHNYEKLCGLFTELIAIQFIITIFLSAIYVILIFNLQKLAANKILYFFSCGVLIVNVFSVEWFFQGLGKFRYIAVRTVLIRILFVVLIIFFVKRKQDVYIFYAITFIISFINSVVNFAYATKFARLDFRIFKIKRHMKPLLYIFFASLAVNIYVVLDTVILGFLTNNDEAVGYYSTALKICKLPIVFITALSAVIIPQISSSHDSGDHKYVENLLQKSFTYVVTLSIPIGIGLYLLAPELIMLLSNEQFLPAVSVIRLLSLLTLLIGLSNIFGLQMLTSIGKEKFTMYAVAIGMVLSVGCNLILIPRFSYTGTALTTLFTELVVTIMTGRMALKNYKVKLPLIIFFQCVIAGLLFFPLYFLIGLLFENSLLRIVLMIVLATVIYFSVLIFGFRNIYLQEIAQKFLSKLRYEKI
jgi:O-antigen/teichoic acid export membrane protein